MVQALVMAADVAADGGDVAAQCSAARANAAVSSSGQLVYSAAMGEAIWLIEARSEVSAIRVQSECAIWRYSVAVTSVMVSCLNQRSVESVLSVARYRHEFSSSCVLIPVCVWCSKSRACSWTSHAAQHDRS